MSGYVEITPKKKVASPAFSYSISFLVFLLVISAIVLLVKGMWEFLLIPFCAYLVLWLISRSFSWFIYQRLSIENKKLVLLVRGTIDTLGGGKTTYKIGKVLSYEILGKDLSLKVKDSTVQEHPFKAKPCKKVIIHEYNDESLDFIKKFMEV